MDKGNRLRCPQCGMCYQGDNAANELRDMPCQNCGATVRLEEEDPEGLGSGALPPALRLIALGSAFVFCILSFIFWFFAAITLVILLALAIEIIVGHKTQRADRIAMWNKLRDAHTALVNRIRAQTEAFAAERQNLNDQISNGQQALATLTGRYDQISPERREQLAAEIIQQQHMLGAFQDIQALRIEEDQLQQAIKELKKRVISFQEEELYQSFGFYTPMYDCVDSAAYAKLLDECRDKQKTMVKNKSAVRCSSVFAVDSDKSSSKKIGRNLERLIIRAFNGECDATIDNVSFSNIDAITSRIRKAYDDLNDICEPLGICITITYLNAKIEELHINYEYQVKLKAEREEQKKIREEMREQARLAKEIEEAKKKIEKEETHFTNAITEIRRLMAEAAEHEREQYQAKLKELEDKLSVVEKDKEQVLYREQSTRAGYVYIISNIGAFGENMYKIGVTRRLEPQERVDELGDASVPFEFDVHAMIFSDDAPALEGAMHERFADRAVNKVNSRKEFFRVSLAEIEEVVRTHHNKVVEFTKLAKAEDYRLSLAKEKAMAAATEGTAN